MFPGNQRVQEIRDRFRISNGRVMSDYRYKNLNWYLGKDKVNHINPGEWFLFGDIDETDIIRFGGMLEEGEILILGWKDMGPDQRQDSVFRDGGGLWLAFTKDGVIYDLRNDGRIVTT